MQLIPCDSGTSASSSMVIPSLKLTSLVFSGNNLLGYFALKTDVEAIRDSYIQLERADIAVFLRQRRQIMQEIDTVSLHLEMSAITIQTSPSPYSSLLSSRPGADFGSKRWPECERTTLRIRGLSG